VPPPPKTGVPSNTLTRFPPFPHPASSRPPGRPPSLFSFLFPASYTRPAPPNQRSLCTTTTLQSTPRTVHTSTWSPLALIPAPSHPQPPPSCSLPSQSDPCQGTRTRPPTHAAYPSYPPKPQLLARRNCSCPDATSHNRGGLWAAAMRGPFLALSGGWACGGRPFSTTNPLFVALFSPAFELAGLPGNRGRTACSQNFCACNRRAGAENRTQAAVHSIAAAGAVAPREREYGRQARK